MQRPRTIIVGGGFGGLAAAKALRKTPTDITLIDRNNHNLFQPLLYQVATSVLSPGQIAVPIRGILRKQKNLIAIMGEVTGIDKAAKCLLVNAGDRQRVPIQYDYLILATGVTHSYFGHPEFEKFAPGLKSLADAVAIRNRILGAFEQAEAEPDPAKHRELLSFVLIGGGPTGVEMAAAIAVLVRTTLRSEFRRIDQCLCSNSPAGRGYEGACRVFREAFCGSEAETGLPGRWCTCVPGPSPERD
jgi:NADH dehydrogenase